MIICGIFGYLLGAIITGILTVKLEERDPNNWDENSMLFAMYWPLVLIFFMCKPCVMYVKYIRGRKERAKNLKQEKRDEVENVLKEL